MFFVGEFAEGSRMLIIFDNIARGNYILEAVAFCNFSALLALATYDEHSRVLLSHFSHGGVAADELTGRDFDVKLVGELYAPLLFRLASAVCDENVGSGVLLVSNWVTAGT